MNQIAHHRRTSSNGVYPSATPFQTRRQTLPPRRCPSCPPLGTRTRVSADLAPPAGAEKAGAHPGQSFRAAVEAFLLSRRVGNCSSRTLEVYEANLTRFERTLAIQTLEDAGSLAIQRYLTSLHDRMKPVSVHQHFRTLKTFFAWASEVELLATNPMRGFAMRIPKTLPRVPEGGDVQKLLRACPDTFEGRRNRALIALLADSGLRVSEALHLRIEDVNFATRTLSVRGGKSGKDGVGFFGAEAAKLIRAWLAKRVEVRPEDYLFVDRAGRGLVRHHATHILHRLSVKAGLPRKVGPHALRHYAATSILRQTGDLELVRQVLRHESLAMALRYAHLTRPDVSAKFRRASPLDNLRAGR
jgi:integrase/recombinase XerC